MAIRFIDGFDHFTDAAITQKNKWSAQLSYLSGASDTVRRFTGFGRYSYYDTTARWIERSFGSNEQTGVFGAAMRIANSASNLYQTAPFIIYDGTSVQLFIIVNTNLTVSLCRGSTANVIATSTATLPTNTWFYLEWKFKVADTTTTGDNIVYIDGVSILNPASGDTQATANAYGTKYRMNGDNVNLVNASLTDVLYDDHYWLDLSGSSPNNAPLGPVRVVTLFPSANGTASQFVNSNGNSTNNYSYVQDALADDDSSYVESGVVGNRDTYAYDDLPSTTNTIFAVARDIVAKKTDVGTRTFKGQVRIGATNYEGTETTLSTGYINYQEIMAVSPATAAAWTVTEVNGAEFGQKVQA